MENTRRRRSGVLRKIISAVFAFAFVASFISSITAFAATNLFKIQNAELTELSATTEGSVISFDEANIASNVTFHQLGDSAKYKITLKNTDSKNHTIESITDSNENPYVSYEYDQHMGEQIDAGADFMFVVTAKYSTATTDINQRAQVSNVKFFIHFTDIEEEILIVPNTEGGTLIAPNTGANSNTGNHIHFSILSLVISAAGLTIIGIIAIKKNKKASKFIAVGIVAVAAIAATTAVKAATVEINSFSINANYGLKDKLVVSYIDKDENEQQLIVNYNEPANVPDQSKNGHELIGWEDENGNPVDLAQPITDDIKIHPIYRAHTYTIRFNGNGAAGEMTGITMTFDEAKTLPANIFNFAGREYTGWDTEANGSGTHYDNEAEVKNLTDEDNGIVTLYAQWSVNPFHINYDGNGATSGEMATTNCEYDQPCQLRENAFEKYGYDFAGWKYNNNSYTDKADVTNITESGTITMQAQWTPHVYTITYTGLTDEEAAALRAAGNPDTYTIETASFTLVKPEDRKDADGDVREHCVGWRDVTVYEDVTLPIANALDDKTYEAVWQTVALEEFNITYDYDGGDVITANPTKLTKEQGASLNEPTKTGYAFTGWTGTTISGDTPVKPYTIPAPHQKGDLEFTAHYRAHTYTVNFDINTDDTSVSGTMQPLVLNYDEEKDLTANAFTRTGYTFTGWKLGDTEYTDGQTVKNLTAEDGLAITLKAQWTPTEYTVIFHANNDNVENPDVMTPQVITYDTDTELNVNQYTWYQHKIVEWTTNANGTGTKYADKASVKNLNANGGEVHLYAKWREISANFERGFNSSLGAVISNNPDVTTFTKYETGTPTESQLANAVNVSSTVDPTYLWAEGEYVYWWSEDVMPSMNPAYKFQNITIDNVTLASIDVSAATNMTWMFAASGVKHIVFGDDFDTSNVTTLDATFGQSTKLESVHFGTKFSTTKVTNISNLFLNNVKLSSANVKDWDLKNLRTMAGAFNGAGNLDIDASDWQTTEELKNMGSAFSGVKSVVFGSGLDTSGVTSMANTFSGIKSSSLDISMFDVSSVTNMQSMFDGAKLTSVTFPSDFDARSVTNMSSMFNSTQLINLDLSSWKTAALSDITLMFYNSTALESINFGDNFKVGNITSLNDVFAFTKLREIDLSSWGIRTDAGINLHEAFSVIASLETVYINEDFQIDTTTDNSHTFYADAHLVGGAGSNYATYDRSGIYARIDDPDNSRPGYFTIKGARYIRYHDNDGDDTNDEANYALMKSHYLKAGDSLKKNTFVRDGYVFTGWKDADSNEYTNEQVMANLTESKTPLELYAQWKEGTATLTQGWNNTAALKRINVDATSFEHWTGETPDFDSIDGEENIALSTSNFPVYAWTEDNKIYWWSEATTIYMNASSTRMFSGMEKLQSIDISQFDSSLLTSLEGMFENTTALASINFGNNFQTGNVTNFRDMFLKAKSLTELDLHTWDVSSFNTDLRKVFNGCSSLTSLNLDGWDLSHTTTNGAHDWLAGTNSLQVFSMKGGKLPSNTNSLFADLKATTIDLDNLDTSGVTNMQMMFARAAGAIELDLHTWNVSNVNNMSQMFIGAKFTGINIDGWQTSSLTNITSIFNGCVNLVSIDLSNIDTSKVQDMQGAFMLTPMTTLDLSTWDTSKNTSVRTMFGSMKNVETIYVGDGWSTELITGANDSATLPLNDMTNKLVGGAGTVWSDDKKNGLTYLHLDDPCDNSPGLFSKKNARYVCYYSNIPDGEANAGAKTGDYLMIEGGSLAANTFTRDGYVFSGWKDADGNDYTDEQAMTGLTESKTPLELYAQWIEATSVLKTGSDVNIILKSINPDAVAFTRYNGIPDFDAISNKQVISLSNAVVPTYAWSNDDTIYWWSEAKTVYLNENSGSFFKNLSKLTTIEQTTLDTSKVKNMDYMFQYSGLVDFTFEMDTGNVTSMDAIFANCSKLERLDLSHVDTSKVTNMHGLVADAQKLTYLNLDNFSTASATNLESMFSTVKLMTTLDLTSFDTRKVTNMGWMISYITNLQTIYATDLFVPANNISMPNTLVGGAGSRNLGTSKVYARIDDPDNGNPGYFTMKGARYIRYHDNDGDTTNDETNYALMTSEYLKAGGKLKKNAFTRNGYEFTGWKDADGNDYTDEQVMTGLTESKTPLELYAQWDAAPYTVAFDTNGGEVLQSTKTVTYLQPYDELPTPVKYDYTNSILGGKYSFKEWNTEADGSGDTITPSSIYMNTDDTTLYAIWDDQFTVTIYNGESETPTIASYGIDDMVDLHAQYVVGKQFLYWEVDGIKKSYLENCSMHMFQGKDLTIRAIYGSESDLGSQQPGTYISDIYRQYSNNKVVVRSYSYVPDEYEIVKAGVIATLDADIANGTFDDQTATYVRPENDNGNSDNYYFTWSKSNVTSDQTVYVKAYLKYKDSDGIEHTIYGDLVTATLTE